MKTPMIPVGFVLLAALALGAALVIGALWLVYASLAGIVSVLWRAWMRR